MGNSKNFTGLMKYEMGGRIMREFVGLRPKMYSYLTDDGCADKKAKGTKKFIIKPKINFEG